MALFLKSLLTTFQIYGHSVSADTQELVARMTTCIERVRCWVASNRLRLNQTKTELIWLSSPRRADLISTSPISLFDTVIQPSELLLTVICRQQMSDISPACASTICVSYDLFDNL